VVIVVVVVKKKTKKQKGENGRETHGYSAIHFVPRAKTFRSTAVNFGIVVGIISFGSLTTECPS